MTTLPMNSLKKLSVFYFNGFINCNCCLRKNKNLSLFEAWSETLEKLAFYDGLMFLISWCGYWQSSRTFSHVPHSLCSQHPQSPRHLAPNACD
jgi:hypothetical protein